MNLSDIVTIQDFLNIDPEVVSSMDDNERVVFQAIMTELSSTGDSETLRQLWMEDYDQIPVDIDTFLDDPYYLGSSVGDALYPYWRTVFRKIFAPGANVDECFSGDTKVPLLDGTMSTIKDIHERVQSGDTDVWIYSINMSTGDTEPGLVTNSKCQGMRDTYLVELSNGKSIELTSNHTMIMDTNHEKRVDELVPSDRLKPFNSSSTVSVVSVTKYTTQLVYDITVDSNHTVGLDAGVFVRNCVLSGGIG